MIPRQTTCEGCPLHTKSVPGFCPDKISRKHQIIYWAEAPGKHEIAEGEPFKGQAGFVLKEWLTKAVVELRIAQERGEISYVNTLRCLPPENKQGRAYPAGVERAQAEAYCRQYDPSMDGVKTVVLFGEAAQRLHFKRELEAEDLVDKQLGHDLKGVLGRTGRVYEKAGIRYIFCLHPAYILRQPSLVAHGHAALRVATGQDKEFVIDYMSWEEAMEKLS